MSRLISAIYAESDQLTPVDFPVIWKLMTIDSAQVQRMKMPDGREPNRVIITFVQADRGMMLDHGQATEIAARLGDDIDKWPGRSIWMRSSMRRKRIIVGDVAG